MSSGEAESYNRGNTFCHLVTMTTLWHGLPPTFLAIQSPELEGKKNGSDMFISFANLGSSWVFLMHRSVVLLFLLLSCSYSDQMSQQERRNWAVLLGYLPSLDTMLTCSKLPLLAALPPPPMLNFWSEVQCLTYTWGLGRSEDLLQAWLIQLAV